MKLWHGSALVALSLLVFAGRATAEDAAVAPPVADLAAPPALPASDAIPSAQEPATIDNPLAPAIRARLAESSPAGLTEYETQERAALTAFYEARRGNPLWVTENGLNDRANAAIAEIGRADDWGLNAADFQLPRISGNASPAALADAEVTLTLAMLKYGRFARGGRIMDPTTQLSSYLDRKPQLLEPKSILDFYRDGGGSGLLLKGLHPKHPQFELLRQKYLALRGQAKPAATAKPERSARASSARLNGDARRVLANMEEWRWMPANMGDLYVWNNIPEYTLRVVKNDDIIHAERIVAGLVSKQTPIFSRPMRKIVFRPKWRVPESIMVRELWPSMLKGGGLMYQFGLQLETKDGQPLDWRKMDWAKEDIRNYNVIQPPGPKNLLGVVKFLVPQPAHDLHARHAGQVHVRGDSADVQPRLHARAQSGEPRQAATGRGQGLGRCLHRRAGEERPAEQRDCDRAQDPGSHHLFHGVRCGRRHPAYLPRRLWARSENLAGARRQVEPDRGRSQSSRSRRSKLGRAHECPRCRR